jgi:opacity protein-like surface antigen
MRLRTPAVVLAFLFAAVSAFGQIREGTVEIEPFAGYLWGGHFSRGTTSIFDTRVNVEDRFTYGGRIGYNITNLFEIEGLFQRAETHFTTDSDNGGPVFGGGGEQRLGALDIDYWMGYATFNFGHRRAVPYFSIGMGAARLDPDVPGVAAESDTRYTASAATGVKIFFNPHFALRLDGRYFGTLLRDRDRCCNRGSDWLSNGSATGGLLFAF